MYNATTVYSYMCRRNVKNISDARTHLESATANKTDLP